MKNLNQLDAVEQKTFFDSFDYVFVDIDGVLWTALEPIPGAIDCIRSLQDMGKIVATASNNSFTPVEYLQKILNGGGFNFEIEHIKSPASAIVAYLSKIKFDQEVYVLGSSYLKRSLKDARIKLANQTFPASIETISEFAKLSAPERNVGAVIFDVDLSFTYLELQTAKNYLELPDTVFLAGATDKEGPLGHNLTIVGPGFFSDILENTSGKKPIVLSKPSKNFGDYLVDEFKISDRSRVLFVGDSIESDMGLAANSGFQKLLVFSGSARMQDVMDWKFPEEYKPNFYADSLDTLNSILKKL